MFIFDCGSPLTILYERMPLSSLNRTADPTLHLVLNTDVGHPHVIICTCTNTELYVIKHYEASYLILSEICAKHYEATGIHNVVP
jgi:hypothetical protein